MALLSISYSVLQLYNPYATQYNSKFVISHSQLKVKIAAWAATE
jgi:hypothetical protein